MGGGTKISERGITLEKFFRSHQQPQPFTLICEDGKKILIKELGVGAMVVGNIENENVPQRPFLRWRNKSFCLLVRDVSKLVMRHGGICLEATQVYNRLKGGINDGG